MEFLSVFLDIAPMPTPPGEPGLFAKLIAAVSAAAGTIVWSAAKIIMRIKGNKKK